MKRLFCVVLAAIVLASMAACGFDYDSVGSSDFEPVDYSYEHISQLTDFKCYAVHQDRIITVDGSCAKMLYNLVYDAMGKQEHRPSSSDGDYVHLVFYSGEEEYPSEESVNAISFWGTYTIYEDGLLVFSGSPYHSAAFDYQLESDLYDSVVDILSGESE